MVLWALLLVQFLLLFVLIGLLVKSITQAPPSNDDKEK